MARRFTSFPSLAIIRALAGIVIVDAPLGAVPGSAPFGKAILVGETEDGPFNTPTQLLKQGDQAAIFGGFGFTYGSTKFKYPCALRSGGSESWNGNLYLHTTGLAFGGGAVICRVDTSIGEVTITPRAYVQATKKPTFSIAHAATTIFTPNGGGAVTATWSFVAASHTGAAGTFNSFTGGETLQIAIGAGALTTVTFQPGDTTLTAIINRINATFGLTIASNSGGQLKIADTVLGTSSKVIIAAGAAATTLGLTAATYNGSGDAADSTLVTLAELKTKLETASALVKVSSSSDGYWRLVSKLGGTGTIAIGNGTANTALGLTNGTSATAALAADVIVSAGTRCNDGGAASTLVVTMQTYTAAKGSTAATNVKVRPAVDDGTFASVSAGNIDTMDDNPGDGEWAVTNIAGLSAALTASDLDSRYLTAIAACVGISDDTTRKANGIASARVSASIGPALTQNAVDTSANGHYGRVAFVSPPNGTTAAQILGGVYPGISVGRNARRVYAAGGVRKKVQALIDGGYSTTGEMVQHPDMMALSRWGSLTPGYDFGQFPEENALRWDTGTFLGLEPVAAAWDTTTYVALNAAGVAASEFSKNKGVTFQMGLASVDPLVDPNNSELARLALADNIGDSLDEFANAEVKRQATSKRVNSLKDSIEAFLDTKLEGGDNTVKQYLVTVNEIATNVWQYTIAVDPIGAMKQIVFNLKVGPNAVALSQAA